MPNEFKCLVDTTTCEWSDSRAATGVLAVYVRDAWFPEELWTDFPVRVLGDWLSKLNLLQSGHANSICLQFMEGPFQLRVIRNGPDGIPWTIAAEERQLAKSVKISQTELDLRTLVSELTDAAAKLIAHAVECEQSDNSDVKFLRKELNK
jgi:hypothetical protein